MEDKIKIKDIKILNFRSISHMSFDKYHTSKSKGTISCPGLPIDNKEFYRESISYKNKNGEFFNSKRNKSVYYIDFTDPEFKTFEELVKHYCKDLVE